MLSCICLVVNKIGYTTKLLYGRQTDWRSPKLYKFKLIYWKQRQKDCSLVGLPVYTRIFLLPCAVIRIDHGRTQQSQDHVSFFLSNNKNGNINALGFL